MPAVEPMLPSEVPHAAQRQLLPAGASVPSGVIDAEFSEVGRRQLRDYLRLLYKYRSVAASCLAVMVGGSLLVTLLRTPLYTASTRLQVARQSPIQLQLQENVLRVDENDRNVNGTSSFLETQIATLKSRDLAERVIRGQRLADDDGFLHPGAARLGLFSVSGRLLSLVRPRGFEPSADGPAAGDTSAPADVPPALIDRYMGYLGVQEIRGTDAVEVRFTTPNPSLSAFLAAAHTQAYMEANEEARRA